MPAHGISYSWEKVIAISIAARCAIGVKVSDIRMSGEPVLDSFFMFGPGDIDDEPEGEGIEFNWLGDD